MEEFKKGDVVKLKSGGPEMTITQMGGSGTIGPLCVWFDDKEKKHGSFTVESLKKVE